MRMMVNPRFPGPATAFLSLVFLLVAMCPAGAATAAPGGDAILHRLRAERRAGLRQRTLAAGDKSRSPAFGLLVIPVDFADSRFADTDAAADGIGRRVAGSDPQSLRKYFLAASQGRLDLVSQVSPVVHLAGARRDYSDIDLNGFSRTRAMAREALEQVAAWGVDFARLDADGPDGVPGSGDDDGEVDGVLLVHAGPGQENDRAGGLIQALQYYLEEPVYAGGVAASFYAVTSAASGPGIWAHETGHLMGMEDRYDPYLAPAGASEVVSRGGLGIFSLMSAGAWGAGGGQGPALPDAYTRLAMGWADAMDLAPYREGTVDLTPLADGGRVGRMAVSGSAEEYFLLEVRSPVSDFPFDAAVPGGNLVVYHVDESVQDGIRAAGGPGDWHLRVGLVEADGNVSLHDGVDTGGAADLFPGTLGIAELPASGLPSMMDYAGFSRFALSDIQKSGSGVSFTIVPSAESGVVYSFAVDAAGGKIDLEARTLGGPLGPVSCDLVLDDPAWGTFAGGADSVRVPLAGDGSGAYRPTGTIVWIPGGSPPVGASTEFRLHLVGEGAGFREEVRTWVWRGAPSALDFQTNWPGAWEVVSTPQAYASTWHRWAAPAAPSGDGSAILACTGADFTDASGWPDVHYENNADPSLLSPAVASDVMAVRLVHAIESETMGDGIAVDGGRAVWVGPDGEIPAAPSGGYPYRLSSRAANVLQGAGVFACDSLSLRGDQIVWQVDILQKPVGGPWRLRLDFGSNSRWRRRGWFVTEMDPLTSPADTLPFAASWREEAGLEATLVWTWPWPGAEPASLIVQAYVPAEKSWVDRAVIGGAGPAAVARSALRAMVGDDTGLIRLLTAAPCGWVATRPVALGTATGAPAVGTLGLPWPNPGTAPIRIEATLPESASGSLVIYDLRGRRIDSLPVPPGNSVLGWNGLDGRGKGVPAGLYFLRLEGIPDPETRKVILLR